MPSFPIEKKTSMKNHSLFFLSIAECLALNFGSHDFFPNLSSLHYPEKLQTNTWKISLNPKNTSLKTIKTVAILAIESNFVWQFYVKKNI